MNIESNKNLDSLNEPPPNCSTEFVRSFVQNNYRINARVKPLACERDQIFALYTENEEGFVLRFINSAEERQVTNFQTEALSHLNEVNPDLPVPRLVQSINGDAEIELELPDGRSSIARLITLLPGIPLATEPERNPNVRSCLATTIANLDRAFENFSYSVGNQELLWDLKHMLKLQKLVQYLPDKKTKEIVGRGFDHFEQYVLPIYSNLRTQVIHNDLNFSNVMIAKHQNKITGIIDFGDMILAPLINDLAVALAYQLSGDEDDALTIINNFTFDYHQIIPLYKQELGILYDLIFTRQVMVLLITQWRANLYPENRQYILRNYLNARVGIIKLETLGRDKVTQAIVKTCLNSKG